MTTQALPGAEDRVDIEVRAVGTRQTRRELRETRRSVMDLGGSARGLALPFLGGALLAGLFGGALASLLSGSAAVTETFNQFGNVISRFLDNTLSPLLDGFNQWFSSLSEGEQNMLLMAAAVTVLLAVVIGIAGPLTRFIDLIILSGGASVATGLKFLGLVAILALLSYFIFKHRDDIQVGIIDAWTIAGAIVDAIWQHMSYAWNVLVFDFKDGVNEMFFIWNRLVDGIKSGVNSIVEGINALIDLIPSVRGLFQDFRIPGFDLGLPTPFGGPSDDPFASIREDRSPRVPNIPLPFEEDIFGSLRGPVSPFGPLGPRPQPPQIDRIPRTVVDGRSRLAENYRPTTPIEVDLTGVDPNSLFTNEQLKTIIEQILNDPNLTNRLFGR